MIHMPSGNWKHRGLSNQNSLKVPALDWAGKQSFGQDLLSLSTLFQQLKHWLSYVIFSTAVFKLYKNAQESHKCLQKFTAMFH